MSSNSSPGQSPKTIKGANITSWIIKEGRRALWKAERSIRVLQIGDSQMVFFGKDIYRPKTLYLKNIHKMRDLMIRGDNHFNTFKVEVSDRKGIAFYLPETRILLDELPDDFYELSKSEAKMLYHEFTQKRKELDDKPMLTASMRDLEQSKKMREFLERYKYCIIRVQFADRSVLQGIFQPNEPFQEVINFVKAHLRDDLEDFFLFTTPPKVIPNAEKTLLELKFVPGVKLYFGTPNTQISTFLKEDILINIRSPEIAAREAHRYRMTKVVNEDAGKEKKTQENGTDATTDEFCNCTDESTSKNDKQSSADNKIDETLPGPSNQPKPKTSSTSNQNKVPKWFKPNKK